MYVECANWSCTANECLCNAMMVPSVISDPSVTLLWATASAAFLGFALCALLVAMAGN